MKTALIALTALVTIPFTPPAFASAEAPVPAIAATVEAATPTGSFEKRKKSLSGDWTIIQEGDQTILRLSDDFRAANGPDLKVFLSPTAYEDVTGKTAVTGAINLGALQKTRGGQDYIIPAGVNLADFQSVLIHCEAYAVLWGGSAL